ncbi:helix-turn-helix transcriptional regulator [Hydrogenophaga pseudoflava]|uniref:helix-turn-helix transcriptional regulator n=1 Tax=Hydrogenophaga pseudoflava TaxID=47421 RepID=UPI0027E4DCDA|nr:helix-turn-helix domain-containing protein [Hydrogenophaga pseudoflava]MDQ7743217.1 helix-turn-helix domain-containing protein [Hydrogenophaga pseudoflava]
MNLADIGQLVQARREALGLSQARLARLAGLSRATINQLENGSLVDLGAAKLLALLNLLGLDLAAQPRASQAHALALLSQTASVSYRQALQPGALADALVAGTLPPALVPQVSTLLDEAPLPLIVAGVAEVAERTHTPPKRLWKHLTAWAQALQSPRTAWA